MRRSALTLLAFAFGACAIRPGAVAPPEPSAGPPPVAKAEFIVTVPEAPPLQELHLELLDDVTGFAYNASRFPMERLPDGRWRVTLTPPAGSILRYRYTRPGEPPLIETSTSGEPIGYRLAYISGPIAIHDRIAAWPDSSYKGETGRIIGRVRGASSGGGLAEMLVRAAGRPAWTDGEGRFRIDGLPPGEHTLTVISPFGAYQPFQQQVIIAAGQTTPAEIALNPARPIIVTFELTVPEGTIPGTPVRIAGDIPQLGGRFDEAGRPIEAANMPEMVMVDDTHYLAILKLYAGMDLHYKYTYGDGLWNAERDAHGFFVTRQAILPAEDITVASQVAAWGRDQQSIAFRVLTPQETPPEDKVSLQFRLGTWSNPIPMWRLGEREWFYLLYGPLDLAQQLEYRYCRNLQCGAADDADTPGPDAAGRTLLPGALEAQDEVRAWQWLEQRPEQAVIVAPPIEPRPGFLTSIEVSSAYRPSWNEHMPIMLARLDDLGANQIVYAPAWQINEIEGQPHFSFNPSAAPFQTELKSWLGDAAQRGFQTALRPTLRVESGDLASWWGSAARDRTWWQGFYEEASAFLQRYARLASESGVEMLIIGAQEFEPSLPGATLPNGGASGAPHDSADRWNALMSLLRDQYGGRIALELEIDDPQAPLPEVPAGIDDLILVWRIPLQTADDASIEDMRQVAAQALDRLLLAPQLREANLILSAEISSVEGGANACPEAPDGSCRPASAFESGARPDPDLQVDLAEQSDAINALLLAVADHPQINGFIVRGYYPPAMLLDQSASVHGKPARDVLWYWYPRLSGD